MAETPNRAYPLPDGSSAPAGPYAFQQLGNAIDADVNDILYAPFGHMGKTNSFQSLATPAKVVFTAAQILRGGVTFDPTDGGRLVLPVAGLYRLTCRGYASGSTAVRNRFYLIKNGVTTDPVAGCDMTFDKGTSDDFAQSCTGSAIFAAGDAIGMYASSPVSTWGTSGYNGAFIEAEYVGPA